MSTADAQSQVLDFLKKHINPGDAPLAGNSVHADKRFLEKEMPDVVNYLHYRIVGKYHMLIIRLVEILKHHRREHYQGIGKKVVSRYCCWRCEEEHPPSTRRHQGEHCRITVLSTTHLYPSQGLKMDLKPATRICLAMLDSCPVGCNMVCLYYSVVVLHCFIYHIQIKWMYQFEIVLKISLFIVR